MDMNLFDSNEEQELGRIAPLALRMRPSALSEFLGQERLREDDTCQDYFSHN